MNSAEVSKVVLEFINSLDLPGCGIEGESWDGLILVTYPSRHYVVIHPLETVVRATITLYRLEDQLVGRWDDLDTIVFELVDPGFFDKFEELLLKMFKVR